MCFISILKTDPCEYRDVSHLYPEKVIELKERLDYYRRTALSVTYPPKDVAADPKNFNGFWTPWIQLKDKSDVLLSKQACTNVQVEQVKHGLHLMTFVNRTEI